MTVCGVLWAVSTYVPKFEQDALSLPRILEVLEAFKEHHQLHAKYAAQLITQAHAIFTNEQNLQEIPIEEGSRLTIVGDLHGQLQDLFSIFTINGIPSPVNKYLFNGDFVDRGGYGCEILYSLLMFKVRIVEYVAQHPPADLMIGVSTVLVSRRNLLEPRQSRITSAKSSDGFRKRGRLHA